MALIKVILKLYEKQYINIHIYNCDIWRLQILFEEINHLAIYDGTCATAVDRVVHIREQEHVA